MTERLTQRQIRNLVRKYRRADNEVVLRIEYDGGCLYIQPNWKTADDLLSREYAGRATSITPVEVNTNGKCK